MEKVSNLNKPGRGRVQGRYFRTSLCIETELGMPCFSFKLNDTKSGWNQGQHFLSDSIKAIITNQLTVTLKGIVHQKEKSL